jgi:ribosomal-protein-alanine N-acetyltransferase
MREDDIPAVLEIERVSFSTPRDHRSFLDNMFRKFTFSITAEFENEVIGYIFVNYHLHESHILDIAVHPDFRRRGVATALVNEAISECKKKGCVFMYLKVRDSNTGAKKFYETQGFRVRDVRKKYYDHPEENAVVMMGRI